MGVDEVLETWCTIDDVDLFTGETVTDEQLLRAQDIIDLFSGTTFDSYRNLSGRNLRMLNRAVAYQAGWMNHHPDLHAHMETTTYTGEGASFTPAGENASLLAPFADRYLRRLTWMNRGWRVRRRLNSSTVDDNTPRDSAVADDNRVWTPM